MANQKSAGLLAQRRKAQAPKSAPPAKTVAAVVPAAPAAPKKRTTPGQFWNEVRAEARKITWTSWKETWITSVMVGIMILITAVFFLAIDGVLNVLIQQLLKFAAG